MYEKLKEDIEIKFGKKIAYQKDCKILASSVLSKTGQYLSPSTLRRFFGFLPTNSNPSVATLDILCQFCNYENWTNYCSSQINRIPSEGSFVEQWTLAKQKSKAISQRNCEVIRKNNPIGYHSMVFRSFAEERFSEFLKSNCIATPIIGPGGYGKSTLLVNWYQNYSQLPQNSDDLILFIPAKYLEKYIGTGLYFEAWINSIIDTQWSVGVLERIAENPNFIEGKFIIIIDALDELGENSTKCEKVFNAIHQFLQRFAIHHRWLKLIVSSRQFVWQNFINLTSSLESWYFAKPEDFLDNGANIPPLSYNEIQSILDSTINKQQAKRLVVEELSPDLLNTISYPYYSQLFVKTYNPNASKLLTNRLGLITEFLRKEILRSQFADEKLDILNKIVELSIMHDTPAVASKNLLKELYPIHLKLAGNYFSAYIELLSFGVISEELVENRFGAFTKQIRVTQWTLYELLLVQWLIQKNNGITFQLFKKLEHDFQKFPMLPELICILFEIAYQEENIETLKPFFELSDRTLWLIFKMPTIPLIIRSNEKMRTALIPFWASQPKARMYLFEGTVDINGLVTSSRYLIYNYLKNSNEEKDIFYSKTLLCASAYLNLDLSWRTKFSQEFPYTYPDQSVSLLIQGLWFSCKLLTVYFEENESIEPILGDLKSFTRNNHSSLSESERNEFDFGLTLGLIITKQFDTIILRLERFQRIPHGSLVVGLGKILKVFFEMAKWQKSTRFDPVIMQSVDTYLSGLPFWNSYQTIIVGKSWQALYFLTLGDAFRAQEYMRKSLEISSIAGYKIFEVKILKQLALILSTLGEFEKATEIEGLARSMTDSSRVFELL